MKFIVIVNRVKVPVNPNFDPWDDFSKFDFQYRCQFEVFSDNAPNGCIQTEVNREYWSSLNLCTERHSEVIACVKQVYPSVQNLAFKIREDGWETGILYGDIPEYENEPKEVMNAREIISEWVKKQQSILDRGSDSIYEKSSS